MIYIQTRYCWKPDGDVVKGLLMETASWKLTYELWNITPYTGAVGILQSTCEKSIMGKLKSPILSKRLVESWSSVLMKVRLKALAYVIRLSLIMFCINPVS